jgi:NRAMP (natural resistance-associated macrophage protein)-like metal ion transporter
MAARKSKQAKARFTRGGPLEKLRVSIATLGPGFITGAADEDPSGIGTYAQTGAQFGYLQLWTALLTFPLQAAVQEMCARIGLQTGAGLAEIIRKHYPKPVLYACVALLFIANSINLGADLGAMAAAAQLVVRVPFGVWLVAFTLVSIALEVLVDYGRYSRILRLLSLSILAYLLVVMILPHDPARVLAGTFIPGIQSNRQYLLNIVAVLGTTISPYLFFWQASEEVEEEVREGRVTPDSRRGVSKGELKWMRTDVTAGMFISNAVMWSIILTAASAFYDKGLHQVETSAQAAQMLRPFAGDLAYLLFAAGIIGTGLLAVPILAGSAAYAVAETFKLREGLYRKLSQARRFYGVIIVATLLGGVINVAGINPIRALYYTAILNGIVAPPLLVIIMLIANNRRIMEGKTNGRVSNVLGGITTIAMAIAAIALLTTLTASSLVR